MSKHIVTGGAGFIGSTLVRRLLERGGQVEVIDNFTTGRESNLEEVRDRVAIHRADIRRYEEIAPLVEGADVVYHLAAIPSVPRSISEPIPSHETNVNGTFQLLRACAAGGGSGGPAPWGWSPRRWRRRLRGHSLLPPTPA